MRGASRTSAAAEDERWNQLQHAYRDRQTEIGCEQDGVAAAPHQAGDAEYEEASHRPPRAHTACAIERASFARPLARSSVRTSRTRRPIHAAGARLTITASTLTIAVPATALNDVPGEELLPSAIQLKSAVNQTRWRPAVRGLALLDRLDDVGQDRRKKQEGFDQQHDRDELQDEREPIGGALAGADRRSRRAATSDPGTYTRTPSSSRSRAPRARVGTSRSADARTRRRCR